MKKLVKLERYETDKSAVCCWQNVSLIDRIAFFCAYIEMNLIVFFIAYLMHDLQICIRIINNYVKKKQIVPINKIVKKY